MIDDLFHQLEAEVAALAPRTPLETAFKTLLAKAISAGRLGNYPVASGMLGRDGALTHVRANESIVPTPRSSAHAEMLTLDDFEASGANVKQYRLVTTLEPCAMCTARIAYAKVRHIKYLTLDREGGTIANQTKLPPTFVTALEGAAFERLEESPAFEEIGRRLHELGERIWQRHL